MRHLAIVLMLLVAIGAAGCFKKKKEVTEWVKYQTAAGSAISSLGEMQSIPFNKTDPEKFRAELEKTRGVVDQFLQSSQSDTERASRTEVAEAYQDLILVADLMKREKTNSGQYSSDKLFASSDTELFKNVKQKYQLGPELLLASQPYYFVDSIIHEAWRSAGNHITRATNRLNEEAEAEAKAARHAKPASNHSPKTGM